ncbi:MAG: 2-C-methyl-D-erythritol 4-phosphate cytidylyltransferase [Bacteroidia bacterium]
MIFSSHKKIAVIVAGGKGLRMNQPLPKQFVNIGGKPILMHTVEAFANYGVDEIILVLPKDHIDYWKNLCFDHNFSIKHKIIEGGFARFNSVKNALDAISENEGFVAIHDGVRPFVSNNIINNSFNTALQKNSAVTSVKLKDSIRELTVTGITKNVNRNNYYLVQTPQTFNLSLIKQAYNAANHDNFTDDASVFEEAGHQIHLIEGDYNNIKITTPEDLIFAEALLNAKIR